MSTEVPSTAGDNPTLSYTVRAPQEELRAFALRRLESLKRVDLEEADRIESAMDRALELLQEAEGDDDPA